MSDSFSAHSNMYAAYVLAHGDDEHAIGVQESRDDLLEAMVNCIDESADCATSRGRGRPTDHRCAF